MTELTKAEIEALRQQTVEQNTKDWGSLSPDKIYDRIKHLNFIVDPWGVLNDYKDLQLEGGYTLVTTSISPDKVGTITIGHTRSDLKNRIQNIMKSYVSNHGLTLAQADTFLGTLYYAKFSLLPLLVTVLNDNSLYLAYRTYSREMTRTEYIKWVRKFDLQNSEFNVRLINGERAQLSDLLRRMAYVDRKLKPQREKWRELMESKDVDAS